MADKRAVTWWVEICARLYAEGEDRALPLIGEMIAHERERPYLDWLDDVPGWLTDYYRARHIREWDEDKRLLAMAR